MNIPQLTYEEVTVPAGANQKKKTLADVQKLSDWLYNYGKSSGAHYWPSICADMEDGAAGFAVYEPTQNPDDEESRETLRVFVDMEGDWQTLLYYMTVDHLKQLYGYEEEAEAHAIPAESSTVCHMSLAELYEGSVSCDNEDDVTSEQCEAQPECAVPSNCLLLTLDEARAVHRNDYITYRHADDVVSKYEVGRPTPLLGTPYYVVAQHMGRDNALRLLVITLDVMRDVYSL